ncbi:MAG: phosphoglucosamine mutase [Chloroflexota bacterium]|nr:phosphoglucosamine mutase [Chloroflexota bacterium]
MSKLFGTDGIRGVANEDLKPTLAHALGRAVATKLAGPGGHILVGQDTRRSGDMLVAALMSGGTSAGAHVHALGVCPTPALVHVTAVGDYAAGVMVSASHNPAEDNGLKVLSGKGLKLDDEMEDELETLIIRSEELGAPRNDDLGRIVDSRVDMAHYMEHRLGMARRVGSDLRLHVDCANGSASAVAADILAASGASVAAHYDQPDGSNINLDCGATVPGTLATIVAERGGDVGFSLDGDADRCVAIDERGEVVDGDQLLGIIALDRIARGALAENTVVVSILSNGGLARAVEEAGGRVLRTKVGDRYIVDSMLVSNAGLGGEKSGHVIIREHTTTGDGIVTALEILDILARSGRPLSELAAAIPLDPQEQRTVRVRHKEWRADRVLTDAVEAAEAALTGEGRIVVRPSGTEPALRVMVEGRDAPRVLRLADELAALASERLNEDR